MFKQLENSAKRLKNLEVELADIGRREEEANKKLSDAGENGNIADTSVQRLIKDARTILDLCQGRRKFLPREIARLREETVDLLRNAEEAWDVFLMERMVDAMERRLTKVAQALDGNIQAAKKAVDYSDLPTIHQVQRARAIDFSVMALTDSKRGNPPWTKPGEGISKLALDFIRHANKFARLMGVTIPDETPKK
jgi:hypothetical protein